MAPARAKQRPQLIRADKVTKPVPKLRDQVTSRVTKKRATTKHVIYGVEKQVAKRNRKPADRGQPDLLLNTKSPSSTGTYPTWLSSLKHPLNDFSDNVPPRHENLGLFEGQERARRESVNTTESAVKTARFADLHERVMVWASRIENEPSRPMFSTGRNGGPTQAAQPGQDTRGQDIRFRPSKTIAALDSEEDVPIPSLSSSPVLHERYTGTVNRRRSARLMERKEAAEKSKKRNRRKTT
ncbi:hypothetical protein BDZ85DRAFT_54456 [Elsinoe ampelina]|uniref:Uncharacterized protein n=1 Tax=Elsinoe ampelina TaxID=302913 RepID=A0A6A6GM06_9PEZI|nr:hypothetical protein BDZ85DRAFT_54456 [Elsinoe ampelina]